MQFAGVILGILAGGINVLGVLLYANTLEIGVSFVLFVGNQHISLLSFVRLISIRLIDLVTQ
jgi:hypothetical protein